MKRATLICLSLLLLLPAALLLTPASHAANAREVAEATEKANAAAAEADRQEALKRLQLLKQQLIDLKNELAKVKEEKAREEESKTITSGEPSWRALPGLDQHPVGYGLYAYVLMTSSTPQQDAIAVLTLLETGPGSQAEKTFNSTLFLVPADDKDGRIRIENYKEILSNRLLKGSDLSDAVGPVLLLTVDPFLDSMPEASLGIDLGGQDAGAIKVILRQLLQPQPIDDQTQDRLRRIVWQLADVNPQKKIFIQSKDTHIRVNWSR